MSRTQTKGDQIADKTITGADLVDNPVIGGSGSLTVPVGTNAQRDAAADGKIRYNSDLDTIEMCIAGVWLPYTPSATTAALQVQRTTNLVLTTTAVNVTCDTVNLTSDSATLARDGTNTDRLVAKKSGIYMFTVTASITDGTVGILNTLRLKLNNASLLAGGVAAGASPRANTSYQVSQTVVVSLNANDFVNVEALRGAGSGTITALTIVAVKVDSVKGDPGQIGGSDSYKFYAAAFENPNSADWAVNGLAPALADATRTALTIRSFDDTAEEGVGFMLTLPPTAVNMQLGFKMRAATAPPGSRGVVYKLYARSIPTGAAVGSWTSQLLTAMAVTDANFKYFTQNFTLAALGYVAGNMYQFQITRAGTDAGDTLTGDAYLLELEVAFG